jgi:tetratricopeptide (TPR) repeat protein
LEQQIDLSLRSLERLDLIRARALQPDLEYIFKHALTQEVVYNGLLKKERRAIHERIGLVMEQLFHDRLPEFYETLAYHFKQSQSIIKAVNYLMKAGEKSLKRYALEESHQYYREAFNLLSNKTEKAKEDELLLIDLIIDWAMVFYYRADCKGWEKIFLDYKTLAETLGDKERLGMFYAWLGFSLWFREKYTNSYEYLCKAIQIGEDINNQKVIGYGCTWLCWTCAELGLFDEAITHGKRAQKIAKILGSDQYLYFKSLAALANTYIYKGEIKKALDAGQMMLDYGHKHSNIRSISLGHTYIGYSHFIAGDYPLAKTYAQKAVQISVDPLYSIGSNLLLGFSHAFLGEFEKIGETAKQEWEFMQEVGCEVWGATAEILVGLTYIANGQMGQGLKMVEKARDAHQKTKRRGRLPMPEYVLGKIYLQIVEGENLPSFSILARNIGFMVKNVPAAAKKAEDHFKRSVEFAKEVGAKGWMAASYLDLGLLHKAKKRTDPAKECISKAIKIYEELEAEVYLQQAKEALASLS